MITILNIYIYIYIYIYIWYIIYDIYDSLIHSQYVSLHNTCNVKM